MQLKPGLVVVLPDPRVLPKGKPKWHICVCPERRLFLRINSRPLWKPWHFIEASENAFLDHDSYVELATLHFFAESELRAAKEIGEMTGIEKIKLAFAAREVETLNDEQKDLIFERLAL
jgi:hypothetical protein